ncbi:KEOPS complex subunit Cgi121 [archaeon]
MKSGSAEGTEYAFGAVVLPEGWSFPTSRLTVQLVAPAFVYGEKHLLASIYSHLKGLRLAKDPGMNLLLRITGIKQIKEAMKAKPKNATVMVVVGKGAATEYKKLLASLKAKDSGDVKTRPGELDAIERSALVGV